MRRRNLLRLGLGGVTGSALAGRVAGADRGTGHTAVATRETIGETAWDSTSGLLTAAGKPIENDDHVLVRARETARVTDEDGAGDATPYGDTRPVLAARDGRVVGLGAMLVTDDTPFEYGNDEFPERLGRGN